MLHPTTSWLSPMESKTLCLTRRIRESSQKHSFMTLNMILTKITPRSSNNFSLTLQRDTFTKVLQRALWPNLTRAGQTFWKLQILAIPVTWYWELTRLDLCRKFSSQSHTRRNSTSLGQWEQSTMIQDMQSITSTRSKMTILLWWPPMEFGTICFPKTLSSVFSHRKWMMPSNWDQWERQQHACVCSQESLCPI